ncbi:pre-B-cell leukemia homeobox interacting protein 1b [Syngnathoides biaculeatus]|uniref:pre-B-cell leukemia homeobox interacting protein 1b n=1 Tax=Syngnathoides biaculeatus TaxID=300417 RepID=UPI002ADDFA1D|nr:pre-B-cell leukemia homeobox interacting protein 1b [Syngnathoides biaculeatus]XP_061676767.1 pre-B-cell leukemia homeobox interacting protein 1b [Syngnathoides biaculeatus]
MSGINSANSSWTIVSPEETAAETVRPLEEQTKHREQDPVGDQPTESLESSCLPVKDHQVAEEQKTDPSEDSSTDRPPAVPPSVTDALIPSTDIQSEAALDSPNQDAFSESLSHMTPSDEAPGSLLSTETLGGVDLTQQDERHDRTWEEDLKQEGEESDLLSKHIDTSEKPGLNEGRAEDTESERKRLLASLERIGRIEEEEEGEEELFQLPRQREHDNMFSLNKCILGAVILVGLGTILFSGAFMDLDEESNYSTRELRDSEETGKQEWLHPEALPPPVDAENSELQAKLEKGNQQISVLQAQLQAQEEELKAAENQAAEGKMEQLQWQEENSRLKSEVASLPVLQKENERLRRELETLPTLQTELETLRSTVTKLTVPSSGHSADVKQDAKLEKKHKHDTGEKKEWNEGNKSEWKEGERKERKDGSRTAQNDAESGKRHHGKSDKVKERQGKDRKKDSRGDEEKMWKEQDGKKEWAEKTERKKLKKDSRGDEEKMWKDQDGKKEWAQNTERKEWKKDKHDKQRRGKYEEKKELRKDGEAHKVKDMWKKKGKGEFQEHGKDKWEPAEKNWKSGNNGEGRGGVRKSVEDAKKQARDKDDRKQWSHSGKGDKDWRKNGDGLKGKKDSGELKGDQFNLHKPKFTGHHHEVNMWAKVKTPPAQEQSSADATDYWTQQRKRLHRKPKQPQHCHSQEACAQAEGLHPVSFPQFESILQAYLTKAEEAGVDSSKREELRKLAAEFFQDGMFMHDRVNFRKFVKDVSDILEDLVEGDGEEDSELEDEMEMFKREALQRFLATGSGGEQHKGEWKKESPRASA